MLALVLAARGGDDATALQGTGSTVGRELSVGAREPRVPEDELLDSDVSICTLDRKAATP